MTQKRDEGPCATCPTAACPARQRRPGEARGAFAARSALARRLCQIEHTVMVLSGKGGVGKSTVAANLAVALAARSRRVGLMDIDIHGPSVPRILGLGGGLVDEPGPSLVPLPYGERLKVMSSAFLLPRGEDDAVIWRGPKKQSLIRQFIADVEWGALDVLVVDAPPGTGDEPLAIAQFIPEADGAVLVTTPQSLAVADVRRSVTFCRRLALPILGIVENMSGFVCPRCAEEVSLFPRGGGEALAREADVPFLGRIPIDPRIVEACDAGRPYVEAFPDSPAARALEAITDAVVSVIEERTPRHGEG